MNAGTERRRKSKTTQKSQKKTAMKFFLSSFCDFCETFATSAFCPRSRIQRCNS
ncbi:hypothetical protein M2165_005172 [Variovorax sp. TBS-050B]|jgi:hypothetical protein|nr:hypothetical protein [Variovorax sp. TBS-050B]